MLKDYPYSLLKQEKQSYEILLLRDQHGNTFSDIAREYEIAAARVAQKYYQIKMKQVRLYINHISAVLGHENTSQVKKTTMTPLHAIKTLQLPALIWKRYIPIF